MDEEKLVKELETYKNLAQQDKNIDVASLMVQALQKQNSNLTPDKQKHWAYLISLAAPPFGLIYAIKFYLSDKDDGKSVSYMCIGLTLFSLVIFWIAGKALLGGSGVSVNQIQQIKPEDIQQLYQ